MKIISGNKVWVQRFNISSLLNMLSELERPINDKVMKKIFGDGFISSEDNFDFVEYEGKDLVDFFRGLDFIVDHEELKGKTDEEVKNMGMAYQKDIVAKSEKMKDKKAANTMCHAAYLRMSDMRYYMLFLQGKINYVMPDFVEGDLEPIIMVNGRMVVKSQPKQEKGIKRILTSIFGKRK